MDWMSNDGLISSSRLAAAIAERGIHPYRPPWFKRTWVYRFLNWMIGRKELPIVSSVEVFSFAEMQEKKRRELMKQLKEEEEMQVSLTEEVHNALCGGDVVVLHQEEDAMEEREA